MFYDIANRFARGDDWLVEDLAQEAKVAFMRAVLEGDRVAEEKFLSYAYACMDHSCLLYAGQNHSLFRLSEWAVRKLREVYEARRTLEEMLGRMVTNDEVAEEMGISLAEVVERSVPETESIAAYESTSDGERAWCLPDALIDYSTQQEIDRFLRREVLLSLLWRLPHNCRRVIQRRVGWERPEPQTHEEIADELGVSRQTTHAWERKGLAQLREMVGVGDV